MTISRQINLMLVEDERIVAFDLKNQLQAMGYRVGAMVGSGEQAVQCVAEVAPDLVLMDIHLEGTMDGVQAATEIQAQHQIPVIYLTAFAEDDTLRRALESRPFGYLVKPWDVRELHASIQMALARREVEVAVERSELRLKLAMDAASLGVFEWLPLDDRMHGDGDLKAMFGDSKMPLDESWEGTFLSRVHAGDRERVVSSLSDALSGPEAVRIEFRTARNNGGPHFLEANVKAHQSTKAERRVVGVLQDVTLRHQTEERLRQSSVVFHTAAEAIVIVSAERRISAVNAAFTRITGYSESESLGFDADVLLRVRRDIHDSGQFFADLDAGPEGYWQGEVSCHRRNGERFPAWQSVSVVRNAAGRVSNYVIAFSDVSEMHVAEEKLHHLAHHDPLTGLPNRLLFDDRIEQAIEQARRLQQHCLLLFLDLDSFKVVNDTLGHIMGDELLRVVAGRLRNVLRSSDTIARLGGDEFVILAGGASAEYAADLAQKVLNTVSSPINLGSECVTVSGSIGIAVYPANGNDRHQMMRAADIAMYSAKAAGRNCYQFYSRDMAERSNERLSMEQGLRRAIDEGQLQVHYQPQVDLADGRIFGVEALVRWNHPELGMIPPVRFIPIAEESGVIVRLGRWVLERACRDILGMSKSLGQQLGLAVNVSAREFARDDFVATVRDTLARTGFPATSLELEITESTLQVIERSVGILGELKATGISISIDDFGTGYSSLSVLRDLPIDRIKIDRSFVQYLPEKPDGIAIVEAIVAIASTMHMDIIVEGIERPEQAAILLRLGCGAAQGYLFSRPVPHAALIDLLTPAGPAPSGCGA
jgi:diguanylate cyclase (GGDEF)-like protein/PAS domain S-box-containing protein